MTPWIATCQAPQYSTSSKSLLKFKSIELVMLSNHLIFCCPLLILPSVFPTGGHRTGKAVFIPVPKKGNAKECSNYCTIALIPGASKVMLKILQARLQQCMNQQLPDVQGGFRKA